MTWLTLLERNAVPVLRTKREKLPEGWQLPVLQLLGSQQLAWQPVMMRNEQLPLSMNLLAHLYHRNFP